MEKKGDYFKQYINEILLGNISLEDPEIFKAYIQLKGHCFNYECKNKKFSYNDAIKRFEPKVIDYLIEEEYIIRCEDDFIHIEEITMNVEGLIDYKQVQSLKGHISVLSKKIKLNKKLNKPTEELEEQVEVFKLGIAKLMQGGDDIDLTSVEQLLSKSLTNKNNIKEDNIKVIENNTNSIEDLNNKKQDLNHTITTEEEELIKEGYSKKVIEQAKELGVKLT